MTTRSILVIGATGLVGGYIVQHLQQAGHRPLGMSRVGRSTPGVIWIMGDTEKPENISLPKFDTLICTLSPVRLLPAMPILAKAGVKRLIAFTSTGIETKINSPLASEREYERARAQSEQKLIAFCNEHQIAWTVFRPTLIYAEGRDVNITPISRIIRKLHFFPIVAGGQGRRQPVHAEDLAIGAISAMAQSLTFGKVYAVPGGETLTYREMVGRIFDGLHHRRIFVPVSELQWRMLVPLGKLLIPYVNVEMGLRMRVDMVFDLSPSQRDFDWKPRDFRPKFD